MQTWHAQRSHTQYSCSTSVAVRCAPVSGLASACRHHSRASSAPASSAAGTRSSNAGPQCAPLSVSCNSSSRRKRSALFSSWCASLRSHVRPSGLSAHRLQGYQGGYKRVPVRHHVVEAAMRALTHRKAHGTSQPAPPARMHACATAAALTREHNATTSGRTPHQRWRGMRGDATMMVESVSAPPSRRLLTRQGCRWMGL